MAVKKISAKSFLSLFYIPVVKENNMKLVSFNSLQIVTTHLFLKTHIMIFRRGLSTKIVSTDSFHAYIEGGLNNASKKVITF